LAQAILAQVAIKVLNTTTSFKLLVLPRSSRTLVHLEHLAQEQVHGRPSS